MEIKPMNPRVKELWVNALECGEYTQSHYELRNEEGYCCLGVLCDLYSKETGEQWVERHDGRYSHTPRWEMLGCTGALPEEVSEWAGLSGADPVVSDSGYKDHISRFNDDREFYKSFDQIANLIRTNL